MGREVEMLPLVPAQKPKKVLVAGGGPGGLEAARVAALRGHDVTLCEKSDRLGGQFWVATLPPGKQQLTYGLKWLAIQAEKAGAKLELGKEVTPALVGKLKPDVVIVATGGAPVTPTDIQGIDKPKVATSLDVLTEKVRCGPKVVVLGGNMVGCEVADWLGYHRKDVTIIEMLEDIALDVSAFSKPFLMDRLAQSGVKTITGARVKKITDDGVVVDRNGQEETISGGDNVVLALGTKPVNELAEQLKGKVAEIHVIGDAKEPRKVVNAICEAAQVARQI
jgi:pyruvate/2-oxoglutarate dehydrogenase complex dihydrolipoamide dehydrogenase (E3) component